MGGGTRKLELAKTCGGVKVTQGAAKGGKRG